MHSRPFVYYDGDSRPRRVELHDVGVGMTMMVRVVAVLFSWGGCAEGLLSGAPSPGGFAAGRPRRVPASRSPAPAGVVVSSSAHFNSLPTAPVVRRFRIQNLEFLEYATTTLDDVDDTSLSGLGWLASHIPVLG